MFVSTLGSPDFSTCSSTGRRCRRPSGAWRPTSRSSASRAPATCTPAAGRTSTSTTTRPWRRRRTPSCRPNTGRDVAEEEGCRQQRAVPAAGEGARAAAAAAARAPRVSLHGDDDGGGAAEERHRVLLLRLLLVRLLLVLSVPVVAMRLLLQLLLPQLLPVQLVPLLMREIGIWIQQTRRLLLVFSEDYLADRTWHVHVSWNSSIC